MIASVRARRAQLRTRRRSNRPPLTERKRAALLETTKRRPRSLGTYLLAVGAPTNAVTAVSQALGGKARVAGLRPAERTRTGRTVAPGNGRDVHTVHHWHRDQVAKIVSLPYKPRIPEYKAAIEALRAAMGM